MLTVVGGMLLSAPAQVRGEEQPCRPHQVAAELSTLAYGVASVSGDDSHYGSNNVWSAPGLGVSYRYRAFRHLALGVALEYQALVGDDADAWTESRTRTFHVTRFEPALALVIPLSTVVQLQSAAGVGVDRVIFDGGWGDFNGPGVHAALRNTFTYAFDEDIGVTGGIVTAFGRAENHKTGDQSYMSGALAFYFVGSLHTGVVWWFD